MKPIKQIYFECPNCKTKFPEFVTRPMLTRQGKIIGVLERSKYCLKCGKGLQRRVFEIEAKASLKAT